MKKIIGLVAFVSMFLGVSYAIDLDLSEIPELPEGPGIPVGACTNLPTFQNFSVTGSCADGWAMLTLTPKNRTDFSLYIAITRAGFQTWCLSNNRETCNAINGNVPDCTTMDIPQRWCYWGEALKYPVQGTNI